MNSIVVRILNVICSYGQPGTRRSGKFGNVFPKIQWFFFLFHTCLTLCSYGKTKQKKFCSSYCIYRKTQSQSWNWGACWNGIMEQTRRKGLIRILKGGKKKKGMKSAHTHTFFPNIFKILCSVSWLWETQVWVQLGTHSVLILAMSLEHCFSKWCHGS